MNLYIMQIQNLSTFLDYFDKIHQRTMRVARCIPPAKIDWTYREGQFTLGDLVRHIATINRYMYAETVSGRPSRYAGCGNELVDGYERVACVCRADASGVGGDFCPAWSGRFEPQVCDPGRSVDHDVEVDAGDGGARGPSSGANLPLPQHVRHTDAAFIRAGFGASSGT